MMGDMGRSSSRMLKLLSLLQTRRDWPGRVLSERLEVSDRTLRRDIDRLRELGYRITTFKGPDGGYRLDAGSELPPLPFDEDQAVALATALQVAAATGAADDEAALRALTTVRQVMPSRLHHRVDSVTLSTLPSDTAVVADPEALLAVSAAVRASAVPRFAYAAVGDDPNTEPPRSVASKPPSPTWHRPNSPTRSPCSRDASRTRRSGRVTERPDIPRTNPIEGGTPMDDGSLLLADAAE